MPGDGKLRFQGVNAQQVVVETRAERKGFFPVGTRYRIWAYGDEKGDDERTQRFDACGVDTENGSSRLILMPEGTELAFKNATTDVIDFYGLTDPEDHTESTETYLKVIDKENPVYELKYDDNSNEIPDLRYAYKLGNTSANTSYILPLEFRHILSKVEFEVVQQAGEGETEAEKGKFGEISLERIEVLDRPTSGTFGIKKGCFQYFADKRTFTLSQDSLIPIGITPSNAGSLLLFPTAETDTMQVRITLKGAANTFNDFAEQEGYVIKDNGATMTVTCPVYDSYQVGEGQPLSPYASCQTTVTYFSS